MDVVLIGGLTTLKRHYEKAAGEYGFELKHLERDCLHLGEKLNVVDALVIFTDRISHKAKGKALSSVKGRGVQVVMSHSSGLSSFKRCLCKIVKH